MNISNQDRISDLQKQILQLRKRATIQQTLLLSLATLLGLLVCTGANYTQPTTDGHFKQVFADSLVIEIQTARPLFGFMPPMMEPARYSSVILPGKKPFILYRDQNGTTYLLTTEKMAVWLWRSRE